ncbi:urease accessory protein UreF [Mycobacterium sp. PSTR-4-N]|uniref:urease accessory protein UreF n=1 Tax=Mycobacterium sp. PSTR-4-N TaxID=2917745 RepID=UPI001F1566B0|nr:urease accessory UreF family protein [Mycobacterium sp. PSTR-4-N]MCG7593228.1 urease accessory protein UreF [Mycobacterium sp. PSTR-4-N]
MPAITTEAAVALALWMQLHDSAFPAGRMVHSHGLEEWLTERPDVGPDDIGAAVMRYLADSYAPLDAVFVAAGWRAHALDDRLLELDRLLDSYKLSDNARTASTSTGRQLASTAYASGLATESDYFAAIMTGATPGHNAVAEGALQAQMGVELAAAVLGSLRTQLGSMLSAAIRLGRLGPLASQRIQAHNVARIVDLVEQACLRDVSDVWSTAPTLEIAGMRHEARTSRLFAT